jgi:hypothetical protein
VAELQGETGYSKPIDRSTSDKYILDYERRLQISDLLHTQVGHVELVYCGAVPLESLLHYFLNLIYIALSAESVVKESIYRNGEKGVGQTKAAKEI